MQLARQGKRLPSGISICNRVTAGGNDLADFVLNVLIDQNRLICGFIFVAPLYSVSAFLTRLIKSVVEIPSV